MDKEIMDRFEAEDPNYNVCDDCKYLNDRTALDFPCSHCEHNLDHV